MPKYLDTVYAHYDVHNLPLDKESPEIKVETCELEQM